MYDHYEAREGDTLESIAESYHVDPQELIRMNQLKPVYVLPTGMDLKVPKQESSSFEYYLVKRGDTIYSIAGTVGISPKELMILNHLTPNSYIYTGQKLVVPKRKVHLYLTRTGDTIEKILEQEQISYEELNKNNRKLYLTPDQIIVFNSNK